MTCCSSTRREELLLPEHVLRAVVVMRRVFATLAEQDSVEAMERFIGQMRKTADNDEFLMSLAKSMQ